MSLRYLLKKLQTDFYLSGITDLYQRGETLPGPNYVIWDCTRRCNLHCEHCGAVKETYETELSTAQIKQVIGQLAALGVDLFAVTGGEPLLRQDLLDVLGYANQQGMHTGIATNGYLIDDGLARRIKETGVDTVQVSLDGLESTHNRIRGSDQSFSRAISALRALIAQKVPIISVATTLTPHNFADLAPMRDLLLSIGVRTWRLTPIMPVGRGEINHELRLSRAQMIAFFEFVAKNNSRRLRIYIGDTLPYLGQWERRVRKVTPIVCPVGFTACCIGTDGYVRGCPEMPDTSPNREGSVLETPFTDIWQQGFERYRTRALRSSDPACKACPDWYKCYGGCWVMREGGQHCIYEILKENTSL